MPIDSVCGGCGKTLRVGDQYAGQKARCPQCGSIYDVPAIQPTSSANPFQPLAEDRGSVSPTGDSLSAASAPTLQPVLQNFSAPDVNPLANPSQASPTGIPSLAPVAMFFVKTPDGTEYGPVESETIEQWAQQGRLNETCFVRPDSSSQWIGLGAWRFHQRRQASVNPFASMPNNGVGIPGVPNPANQNVSYRATPNGLVVLILGIGSWVLCPTIIGSPVCSIIAIIMGVGEFRRVREGKVDSSQLVITHVGFWLGVLNLVCCMALILLMMVGIMLGP